MFQFVLFTATRDSFDGMKLVKQFILIQIKNKTHFWPFDLISNRRDAFLMENFFTKGAL